MSVQATTWVWENATVEGNLLLVLLAIADAANREGESSCQSVATLARMSRTSERTVHRCLAALKEVGLVEVAGRSGRYQTMIYRLPGMAVTPDTGDTCQSDTPDTGGSRPLTPVADNPKELTPSVTTTSSSEVAVVEGRVRRPQPPNHPRRALPKGWYPSNAVVGYLRHRSRNTKVRIEDSFDRFVAHQRTSEAQSTNWDEVFMRWVSQDITRWRSEQEDDKIHDDLGIRRTRDPAQHQANAAAIEARRAQLAALSDKREDD